MDLETLKKIQHNLGFFVAMQMAGRDDMAVPAFNRAKEMVDNAVHEMESKNDN